MYPSLIQNGNARLSCGAHKEPPAFFKAGSQGTAVLTLGLLIPFESTWFLIRASLISLNDIILTLVFLSHSPFGKWNQSC